MVERKNSIVDGGGVGKSNGGLANGEVAKESKKQQLSFNTFPPVCDSLTADSALDNLEKLLSSPDKNSG
jgi:hypothetical protein